MSTKLWRLQTCVLVVFSLGMMCLVVSAYGQPPDPGPNYQHLQGAEWMVGSWVHTGTTAAGESLVVRRSVEWTLNKNYLTGETQIEVDGRLELDRHHMVGWNPAREQPKSWVYDSDGTFATGLWSEFGRRKVGKVSGVRPDGTRISATVTYTYVDENTFIYRVFDRKEGTVDKPEILWKLQRSSAVDLE